jgi:hypothetical protein
MSLHLAEDVGFRHHERSLPAPDQRLLRGAVPPRHYPALPRDLLSRA